MTEPVRVAEPGPARSRAGSRFRLGVRARRGVVVLHVIAAGAWIGIDVMVAVLVTVGWFSDDPTTRSTAYQAVGRFVVAPMLTAGLLCLITGIGLGLATKWGLGRYWWVLVKLAITVALCTLIIVALQPGMGEVTAAGVAIGDGRTPATELSSLFFPPAVSLSALSIAVVLSVYKPWGRTRGRAEPSAQRTRGSPVRG
jgi:hypothetical protein